MTMIRSKWLSFAAAGLLAATAFAGEAAQNVSFAPKFTKGAENRYTMEYNTTNSTAGMGDTTSSQWNRKVWFTTRVKEVNEQTHDATIDVTYERISMDIKEPNRQVSFDSKNPVANDPKSDEATALRPICGQTFQFKVDQYGEITSVTPPANLPPQSSMGAVTRDFVTTTGAQRVFGRVFGFGATKPMNTGESWNIQSIVTDAPLDLRLTNDFKLTAVKGNEATVTSDAKAVVEPSKNASPLPFNLSEFKATGTYGWNTKTGMLKNMNFNWKSAKTGDMNGLKLDLTEAYTIKIACETGE
ncbi:MAG TPA: DUF6263 family protein [Phycisphaerales bacterium]|nr:DUF6263 family protein [Phycisphaerales bacterium]